MPQPGPHLHDKLPTVGECAGPGPCRLRRPSGPSLLVHAALRSECPSSPFICSTRGFHVAFCELLILSGPRLPSVQKWELGRQWVKEGRQLGMGRPKVGKVSKRRLEKEKEPHEKTRRAGSALFNSVPLQQLQDWLGSWSSPWLHVRLSNFRSITSDFAETKPGHWVLLQVLQVILMWNSTENL